MKVFKSLSLAVLTIAITSCAAEQATEQRLDEVAVRGRHVMPFNLEQTTHIFNKK